MGGYYPTPEVLLPLIASYIAKETQYAASVLDPCAGEGMAVATLAEHWNLSTVLACELERTRYQALARRKELAEKARGPNWKVAHGDAFTLRADKDNGIASVLYLNPPYDLDPRHKRLEHRFLTFMTPWLRSNGVLVYVVPHYALEVSVDFIAKHYGSVRICRFPGEHYNVFKQVVLFASVGKKFAAESEAKDAIMQAVSDPLSLPELSLQEAPAYTVPPGYYHDRLECTGLDLSELRHEYKPFSLTSRTSYVTMKSAFAPPRPSELGARVFPTAMPPKPAHLAAGIATGVFDGVVIQPDDPNSGLPSIMVKGCFDREYVPVEEKTNQDGHITAVVEVQAPRLTVTALDLATRTYHTIASEAHPSGQNALARATTADLLAWYSKDLLASLLAHCPVMHDPNNPAHQIELAPLARPLYKAQAQVVMGAVKLLGGPHCNLRKRAFKSVLMLGEVGVGKTPMALSTCATIKAKKALVMCPPHLLDGWTDQIRECLPDSDVRILSSVQDVDDFNALRPAVRAVGILSREAAKLGHSYSAVKALTAKGARACPKCGAPVPKGDLAHSRATCQATVSIPRGDVSDQVRKLFQLSLPVLAPGTDFDEVFELIDEHQLRLARKLSVISEDRKDEFARRVEVLRSNARFRSGVRLVARMATKDWGWKQNDGMHKALLCLLVFLNDEAFTRSILQWLIAGLSLCTQDYTAHEIRTLAREVWLLLSHLPNAREEFTAEYWPFCGFSVSSYGSEFRAGPVEKFFAQLDSANPKERVPVDAVLSLRNVAAPKSLRDAVNHLLAFTAFKSSAPCGEPLYQAEPSPRRVALASYIAKKYPKFADVLILDEVQEFATDGSAQELAAHRLAALGWPTLYLTGSVMNGYAESLFTNFWSLSSSFRAEFKRSDRKLFVERYGYRKRVVSLRDKEDKTPVFYGSQSDRVERVERDSGNAPGVLPLFVLRHMLPTAVVLHKADLKLELPPLTEEAFSILPDSGVEESHLFLTETIREQIKRDRFKKQSGQLLGALASLPQHPDRASADTGNAEHGQYVIAYPNGVEVCSVPPVCSIEGVLAKEHWMIDRIKAELAEDRRVMVLAYNQNVLPRLARLIEKHVGTKVAVLHADKVSTAKRQAWIDTNVVKPNRLVMVANPTTIKTGLNNLVHFCTQVWMQNPACDPVTYRQVVGRMDRIGQKKPTRSLFPYYGRTLQDPLHNLLQRKVLVSTSTDGLDPESSMAAAGMVPDLTLQAMSVGRQLFKILEDAA